MNRYVGNAPNEVFVSTAISAAAAKKADSVSFLAFLLKQPYNLAIGLGYAIWNATRASKCVGGNGFSPTLKVLNLTKEESDALYAGSKKLGASPFAVFTYAAQKAMKEVVGQPFNNIVNQASLQREHFPTEEQGGREQGGMRDYVGDWLVGPATPCPADLTLAKAHALYEGMVKDVKEFGPMTQRSFAAKAWGIENTGAAGFEAPPTYNDAAYLLGPTLFMNNYGVRTVENPSFEAWNWQAPMWLGVNTICVNGRTTTMVGSMVWGQQVMEAVVENMEETIREIIAEGE
jgi:hypothetical protein